jgi:hypothetical protein
MLITNIAAPLGEEEVHAMTHVGILGIAGLAVIIVAMVLWFTMTVRANRRRMPPRGIPDQQPPRGPVMGGQQSGDPGQVNPTRDEPTHVEEPRRDEEPRENRDGGTGPLDL